MAVTINGTTGIVTPDIGVDGTTLVIDAVNNRIGIGTASPDQALDVESNSNTSARITAHGYICRDNWGSQTGMGNGMFSPAANTLAFTTNSVERLRIDSSGNSKFISTNRSMGKRIETTWKDRKSVV